MAEVLNATNAVFFDYSKCNITICPLSYADVFYIPSLAGNAVYLAIFAVLLAIQAFLGIRYRNWGFMVALVLGLVGEIVGYVGRVQMHENDWLINPFLQYLIALTISPCFFTAAIYLCLARIMNVYGPEHARFKPRTYTKLFICSDFLALLLQAAGGGITAVSNMVSLSQTGIDVMMAGLAFQVVSLVAYMALCGGYMRRVRQNRKRQIAEGAPALPCSPFRFGFFLYALVVATVAIFIRSCFRVAELRGGFKGPLANNQVTFMILEGAMIVIATIALTVGHPGIYFGKSWGVRKTASASDGESGSFSQIELMKTSRGKDAVEKTT